MSKIRGGAEAARQNFSMHPALLKVFIDTANQLNTERADLIITNRSQRVTYSKVAAAMAYHIQRNFLGPNNQITDAMRRLIDEYEACEYESTDTPAAEIIRRPTRPSKPPRPAKSPPSVADQIFPPGRPLIFNLEDFEVDDEL
jgi:hypothetical protein